MRTAAVNEILPFFQLENMPTIDYFLQTEYNDWDLKKAFVIYLEEHSFPEAKKFMKEDLKLYTMSPIISKKAANKANLLLKQLDKESAILKNLSVSTQAATSQINNFEDVAGNVNISNSNDIQSQNATSNNTQSNQFAKVNGDVNICNRTKREGPSQTSQQPKKLKSEHVDEIDELFDPPEETPAAVDFDNLPIVVDPLLSQDVLRNLEDIGPYKCEDVEYGKLFMSYKTRSFQQLSSMNQIYLEPNFYKLIALEHVLFLKPGSYSSDMIDVFGENNLNKLYKHLVKKHFHYRTSEQETLISNIANLFEESFFDYQELEFNMEQLLAKEVQPLSKMVIRCVLDLLISLPQYKENNVINELDLKIRYLNPVLKYFFNDVKKKFKLRWPESNPAERKVYRKEIQRPDLLVTAIPQATYRQNIAYGEVKSSLYQNRSRSLILDMYRLVHFSKSTIDVDKINCPITIQIVGSKVNVYMNIVISKKFYVMLFLFNFDLPLCLDEIENMLPSIKKMISLHHALASCNSKENQVDEAMINMSKGTPLFERRVESRVCKDDDMEAIQLF
ncbi:hypothetical protein MAM1_0770c11220 [Mucor ambiguus]|uniref:Uncharacterized protein n=1 Tax=Mucor ambiguus TaxID=91626 RepID=A0A0C9MLG1_9FUNG|nr:hypothetical protein MAM1_0770c11220 [Mucor ambiguus]